MIKIYFLLKTDDHSKAYLVYELNGLNFFSTEKSSIIYPEIIDQFDYQFWWELSFKLFRFFLRYSVFAVAWFADDGRDIHSSSGTLECIDQ